MSVLNKIRKVLGEKELTKEEQEEALKRSAAMIFPEYAPIYIMDSLSKLMEGKKNGNS